MVEQAREDLSLTHVIVMLCVGVARAAGSGRQLALHSQISLSDLPSRQSSVRSLS
jgi:hypothetical protein